MGKKSPRLTVVQGQARSDSDASNALEILSLSELSDAKSRRVEAIIGEFCPNAGVLGIAVTGRNWDLRPFVALSTEDGPSVIRFLGPEVSMCKSIQARTQDILERISRTRSLDSALRDWGVYEEQLWFRRGLVDHTLGDLLAENDKISLSRALELCSSVIATVATWHTEGIIHGHISIDNIIVEGNEPVGLIDAGVGLALVQSSNSFGFVDFPSGYSKESFAPETLAGETLVSSSDVFGVSRVIQDILELVDEHQLDGAERETQRALLRLAAQGVTEDPTKRPSLDAFSNELQKLSAGGKPKGHQTVRQRVVGKAPARGKTIQPRKGPKPPESEAVVEKAEEPKPNVPNPESVIEALQHITPEPHLHEPSVVEPPAPTPRVTSEEIEPEVLTPTLHGVRQTAEPVMEEPIKAPEAQPIEPQRAIKAEPPEQVFSGAFAPVTSKPKPEPIPQPIPQPEAPSMAYSPAPPQMEPAPAPPRPQSQPLAPSAPNPNEQSWTPLFVLMGLVLLAMHLLFDLSPAINTLLGRNTTPEYTFEELRASWRSNDPMFMAQVVEAAINPNRPNEEAQKIIVRSIRSGDEALPGMNIGLLRVAFHEAWQAQLTTADRQAALVFGLSDYLRANSFEIPAPLVAVRDLNAGVILALTANAYNIATRKALSGIPLSRLLELPIPFGPAFKALEVGLNNADCSNAYVHMLSRLLTVAPETIKALEIKQFVEGSTESKLGALAVGFSQDPKGARKILNDLINHANIKVSHPYIDWGRSEQLSSWVELVDNDKLFVLAGFPPSQPVNPGNLGRMFLHPSAAIRGFAVENAIDQITFRHPGAVKVLLSLKGNPNLLSAEQTFKLAVFLENPANATEDKIRPWLETKPDPKLLETLLLSSANESGVDTGLLDFEIASYLQRNKWRFDIPKLQVLALHNDAFTRSYAYFETAKLRDTKMALQILETALAQETDPNFRVQLQSNIETLKAAGTSLGN